MYVVHLHQGINDSVLRPALNCILLILSFGSDGRLLLHSWRQWT